MPSRILSIVIATIALGCGVAACGGDDETSTSTSSSSTTTSTTESTTTEAVDPSKSKNVNTDFGFLPPDIEVDEREGTPPADGGTADLEGAAEAAGCDLQVDLPDEGNTHFDDQEKEPDYGTSPPTSGDHFFSPNENGAGALADGAFLDQAPDNRVVHSLEHGRVAIQYSPDLPEEDQLALKGLFDSDRPGLLLFPNADMPYEVAATAWTALLGLRHVRGRGDGRRRSRLPGRIPGPGPRAGHVLEPTKV